MENLKKCHYQELKNACGNFLFQFCIYFCCDLQLIIRKMPLALFGLRVDHRASVSHDCSCLCENEVAIFIKLLCLFSHLDWKSFDSLSQLFLNLVNSNLLLFMSILLARDWHGTNKMKTSPLLSLFPSLLPPFVLNHLTIVLEGWSQKVKMTSGRVFCPFRQSIKSLSRCRKTKKRDGGMITGQFTEKGQEFCYELCPLWEKHPKHQHHCSL